MPEHKTRISCEIDFEKDGKQTGFLRMPYSVHRSAYGWLPFPVICIKNGDGPTAYLQSGNHGDEYEGQVTFLKLARELEPNDIQGRVIIYPTANAPAARAGSRTSPLEDGEAGNLNRNFPGDPNGSPTEMIADYIVNVFLRMADYAIDLHSGGSSLMLIPSADIRFSKNKERMQKLLEMTRVFGAPITYIGYGTGTELMSHWTEHHGVIDLATELGGGGTVSPEALAVGEAGVRRVLKHIGNLSDDYPVEDAPAPRVMEIKDETYFCYAPDDGLFEPYVDLGADVETGQAAGAIHFPETPWREPSIAHFAAAGTVICKRWPGRTERGDCLFHLASDYAG